jgi:hypothetical protein
VLSADWLHCLDSYAVVTHVNWLVCSPTKPSSSPFSRAVGGSRPMNVARMTTANRRFSTLPIGRPFDGILTSFLVNSSLLSSPARIGIGLINRMRFFASTKVVATAEAVWPIADWRAWSVQRRSPAVRSGRSPTAVCGPTGTRIPRSPLWRLRRSSAENARRCHYSRERAARTDPRRYGSLRSARSRPWRRATVRPP